MRTARFVVPEEWIARSSSCFAIPVGPLHHQIVRVLRMKIGAPITLLPNNGEEIVGVVTDITKSAIVGTLHGVRTLPNITPEITLAAAVTKRDSFEWTLQKATELGVHRIVPLITDRVIKRATSTPPRWQDIVREATEQSGRGRTPIITEPLSIKQALKEQQATYKLFFDEVGGNATFPQAHVTTPKTLFIGPEGGFSDNERDLLSENGAHRITLGTLVFRAETAAIVGLSVLRFGDQS